MNLVRRINHRDRRRPRRRKVGARGLTRNPGLALLLTAMVIRLTHATTLQETFDSNPLLMDWSIHGEASLFEWDSANANLRVTWDSSQTNSYFHRPLNNVLTRLDDFQITANLRLEAVATGTTPGKDSTFQLAFGLVQLEAVTAVDFLRGSGVNATHGPRNIVEFDYFPDSMYGFGATVSPTLVSSNNQFATSFTYPMELPQDVWIEIRLSYTASNSTLSTMIRTNGVSIGPVSDTTPGGGFSDFRVDTLAICSYSDAGQESFPGSILAHGILDDVTITLPDPPVTFIALSLTNGLPAIAFQSRSNWTYTLERTMSSTNWQPVVTEQTTIDGPLHFIDQNPPLEGALYRIQADRP